MLLWMVIMELSLHRVRLEVERLILYLEILEGKSWVGRCQHNQHVYIRVHVYHHTVHRYLSIFIQFLTP